MAMPPPDSSLMRDLTPEPIEGMLASPIPRDLTDKSVPVHWLFSVEIQHVVQHRPILLYIQGVLMLFKMALHQYSNSMARTVWQDQCNTDPPEGEIMISMAWQLRINVISINPQYLTPWEPVVKGDVLVISGPRWGAVGVAKAQVGYQWEVTFTVGDGSRNEMFAQKDLAGLD